MDGPLGTNATSRCTGGAIINGISSHAFFRALPQSAARRLARVAASSTARAGEILDRAGEKSAHVSLLHEGFAVATAMSAGGKATTLQAFGPGEMWGCVPHLLGRPLSVDVRAVVDVRLSKIPISALEDALGEHPAACRALAVNIARQFSRLAQLHLLGVERSDRRICGILLWIKESSGLHVPLTQALLATLLGTTEETVSRVLSPLKRRAVVSRSRGVVEILDPAGLKRILESR